jgi:hypothetical protein
MMREVKASIFEMEEGVLILGWNMLSSSKL